jgi:hypothetical protein
LKVEASGEGAKVVVRVRRENPPASGSIAFVMAQKPDQVLIAEPRSRSGSDALISIRLPRTSKAPPGAKQPSLGSKLVHCDRLLFFV